MNNKDKVKINIEPISRQKSDLIDFSFETKLSKNDTLLDLFDPLNKGESTNTSRTSDKSSVSSKDTNEGTNSANEKNSSSSTSAGFRRKDRRFRANTGIRKDGLSQFGGNKTALLASEKDQQSRRSSCHIDLRNSTINDLADAAHQLDQLSLISSRSSQPHLLSSSTSSRQDSKYSDSWDEKFEIEKQKSSESINKDIKLETNKLTTSKLKLFRKLQRSSQEYIHLTEKIKAFREKYKYDDDETNPGLVFSPTIYITTLPDLSVKLIITSPLAKSPITFTCNISTTIEHLISHAVCSMFEKLDYDDRMENYLLKITGKDEYLDSKKCLGEYAFVNHCCKFDLDLQLTLVMKKSAKRLYLRTQQDDFRVESLLSADDLLPRQVVFGFNDLNFESLNIIIETFERESDRLYRDVAHQPSKLQPTSLIQTTKAICSKMMSCETLQISEAANNIYELCLSFKKESDLLKSGDKIKMIEVVQNAISKLINNMYRLLKLTSLSLPVDYEMAEGFANPDAIVRVKEPILPNYEKEEIETAKLDVNNSFFESQEGQVSFRMHNISQLKPEWATKYQEFSLLCEIKHGQKSLSSSVKSKTVQLDGNFFPRLVFDEEIIFDIFYVSLPREARLVITLTGTQLPPVVANPNQLTPNHALLIGDLNPLRRSVSTSSISSEAPMYTSSPRHSINYPSKTQPEPIYCTLAASVLYLFDHELNLVYGDKLLYMHQLADNESPDKIFIEALPDRLDSVAFIEFANVDETKNISFPSQYIETPKISLKDFNELDSGSQYVLSTIFNEKQCYESLMDDEKDLIWQKREYIASVSIALPKFLLSVPSWNIYNLDYIYQFLEQWKQLEPVDAIQLLLPAFPDKRVRSKAVSWLFKLNDDELCDFVPQLLQALRYEKTLDCALFWLLMDRALKSVRFANLIYWQSKLNALDKLFNQRSETINSCLLWISGSAFWKIIDKQEELLSHLNAISEEIHKRRDSQRITVLHKLLENVQDYLMDKKTTMPFMPSLEVCGLDMKSCSYFPSNALPLKLAFRSYEESCNREIKFFTYETIFKTGDDLRQDMLAIQMIRIMEKLWLKEGLNLRMVTFDCLATNGKQGMVEIVQNAETLRKIQQSRGIIKGPFEKRPIVEWLQNKNTSELEYQQARDNFAHSCAGYAIATYLLGICDRHNDNIMVTNSGHLFHIDFGKFLGDSQMMGAIKRDRTPFVLTADMAYVINNGDRPSKKFQTFIELCTMGFNILRRNRNLFLNLFSLMAESKIRGLDANSVKYIDKMLMPKLSEAEAMAKFTRMIDECLSSRSTQLNFFIHNLAQLRFSESSSKQSLLSFVPKTFSMKMDGKIKSLNIVKVFKRYEPEKQYFYVVRVERYDQLDPTNIIRTFEEFSELQMKLSCMFPWHKLHNIGKSTTSSFLLMDFIHRKNTRDVAQKRQVELQAFLQDLTLRLPAEISESDLIYTFFHPILRDQMVDAVASGSGAGAAAAGGADLSLIMARGSIGGCSGGNGESASTFGKSEYSEAQRLSLYLGSNGQVKVSLAHKNNSLIIVVMHAKNLECPDGAPNGPNAYVKTYLLPDNEKRTKRKTRIIRQSCHPTFMELIVYNNLPLDACKRRTLRVSVWHFEGVVQSKAFMGAALIPLDKTDISKECTAWYPLRNY